MDPAVLDDRPRDERGLTLVELVVGLALILTIGAIAAASARALADRTAGLAAARYLASRLAACRLAALETGMSAGLRFRNGERGVLLSDVRDGNGNGIRGTDLARGLDVVVTPEEAIETRFPGTRFAVVITGPDVDDENTIGPETPPLRIGSTGIVSHSPTGTSSSGTLFLSTAAGRQFAVRVFGPTGRVRVYEYLVGERRWTPR